jgi:hypothetical protein
MGCIENIGDAHEALDECFKLILKLTEGDMNTVNTALQGIGPGIQHNMTKGGDSAL